LQKIFYMFKNDTDRLLLEEAMANDVFYFNVMHLAAKFAHRKKNILIAGRQPFNWRLCEKVWKRKGEKAHIVAEDLNISVAKVYKVWQGIQPSHLAYQSEFGKLPHESPDHYVEWLNNEF